MIDKIKEKIKPLLDKLPLWAQFTALGIITCLTGFVTASMMSSAKISTLSEDAAMATTEKESAELELKRTNDKLGLSETQIVKLTAKITKTSDKLAEFNQINLELNQQHLAQSKNTTKVPTNKDVVKPLQLTVIKTSDYVGQTHVQCEFTNISDHFINQCMGTLVLYDQHQNKIGFVPVSENIFTNAPQGLSPRKSAYYEFKIDITPGKASYVVFTIDQIEYHFQSNNNRKERHANPI